MILIQEKYQTEQDKEFAIQKLNKAISLLPVQTMTKEEFIQWLQEENY